MLNLSFFQLIWKFISRFLYLNRFLKVIKELKYNKLHLKITSPSPIALPSIFLLLHSALHFPSNPSVFPLPLLHFPFSLPFSRSLSFPLSFISFIFFPSHTEFSTFQLSSIPPIDDLQSDVTLEKVSIWGMYMCMGDCNSYIVRSFFNYKEKRI